jgi:hypothetical protein
VRSRTGDPPRAFASYVQTNLQIVSSKGFESKELDQPSLRFAAGSIQQQCVSIIRLLPDNGLYGFFQSIWIEFLSVCEILRLTENLSTYVKVDADAFADRHPEST